MSRIGFPDACPCTHSRSYFQLVWLGEGRWQCGTTGRGEILRCGAKLLPVWQVLLETSRARRVLMPVAECLRARVCTNSSTSTVPTSMDTVLSTLRRSGARVVTPTPEVSPSPNLRSPFVKEYWEFLLWDFSLQSKAQAICSAIMSWCLRNGFHMRCAWSPPWMLRIVQCYYRNNRTEKEMPSYWCVPQRFQFKSLLRRCSTMQELPLLPSGLFFWVDFWLAVLFSYTTPLHWAARLVYSPSRKCTLLNITNLSEHCSAMKELVHYLWSWRLVLVDYFNYWALPLFALYISYLTPVLF